MWLCSLASSVNCGLRRGRTKVRPSRFITVYLAGAVALVAAALAAPPAYALSLTQTGDSVQVHTSNSNAAWSVAVYSSDATTGVIPTDESNRVGTYNVSAGVQDWSQTMSPLHRRYRYVVSSVSNGLPASSQVMTFSPNYINVSPSVQWDKYGLLMLDKDGSRINASVFRNDDAMITRGTGWSAAACPAPAGSKIAFVAWDENPAGSGTYQNVGMIWTAPASRDGTLTATNGSSPTGWDTGTPSLNLAAPGNLYKFVNNSGASSGVDDGGTATFENPEWYGFDLPVAGASYYVDVLADPLKVFFSSGDSSHPLGLVSYHWDFGDGHTSDLANPEYVYAESGNYVVTLTVVGEGVAGSASDTMTVTVFDGNSDPSVVGTGGIDPWKSAGLPTDWQKVLVSLLVGGMGWAFAGQLFHERAPKESEE